MLRATIEIVPFGDEDLKKQISRIEVANIGPRDSNVCNYACRMLCDEKVLAWAYVKDYPRTLGAERLISLVITNLLKVERGLS